MHLSGEANQSLTERIDNTRLFPGAAKREAKLRDNNTKMMERGKKELDRILENAGPTHVFRQYEGKVDLRRAQAELLADLRELAEIA